MRMWRYNTSETKVSKELLKRCIKRLDSSELEILQYLHKELSSRSQTTGIDKETFLQYFNLPGLWGERLFRHFDVNQSNRVEYDEFIVAISTCCRGTHTDKIKVLFHVFDLNDDGVINKSELVAMLSNFPTLAMHMATHPSNERISSLGYDLFLPCQESDIMKHPVYSTYPGARKPAKVPYDKCVKAGHDKAKDENAMSVKKIIPKESDAFKNLLCSLSKMSLMSLTSNESRETKEATEALQEDCFAHCSNQYESTTAAPRTDHTSAMSRGRSMYENRIDQDPFSRVCSVDVIQEEGTNPTSRDGSEQCEEFSCLDSNESITGDEIEQSFISAEEYDDPEEESDSITASTKGQEENVRRFIQGLDEAEIYRRTCCDNPQHLYDSPSAAVAAMAIIEQERLNEAAGVSMDIIVEGILEDYDFNDNGYLHFHQFKAWISKNTSILAMFSQYLHEEVWGLQGNAFMTSAASHEFFLNSLPPLPIMMQESSNKQGTNPNNISSLGSKSKLAQRIIYRMFLINLSEAKIFKNCVSSLENVVSEELLQYLNHVSSRIRRTNDSMADPSANGHLMDSSNPSEPSGKEIYSCPNCATPFFMCPICFKRHECLSLYVDPEVFIACDNCKANRKETRLTSCWICGWKFSEAMDMVLTKRYKQSSQLMRRLRNRKHISPKRAGRSSLQCVSKTIRTDDTTTRSLMKSGKFSLHCSSPMTRKLASRLNLNTRIPMDNSISISREVAKMSLDTVASRNNCIEGGDWPLVRAKLPTKSGYMYKRGRHFFKLKRRYYVLIDNLLYYYVDKDCAKPRGCIFLEGCYLDSKVKNDSVSTLYGLCIYQKANKSSVREFYVGTKNDFVEWVDALSVAMKQQSLMQLYNICEKLGHGKFSVVYRAIYKSTGEEFAVKVVDKTKLGGQERELLRSEIAILRLLRHQHVIYLKDVSDTRDSLYIVMELVRGGELYDLITQKRRLTEAHTNKIICQLLKIVAYLHKCGIIHRDIKPENILLTDKTEEATIKLTDFGLSTLCGPNELLNQPCGTLAYVAPEVLTMQGYNQKADVWSIGVIMYLLLRGRLPFAVKQPEAMDIETHYTLRIDGRFWNGISKSAKDLIIKMLQIDPNERVSVFEALEHIWIKNFVAVTYDESMNDVGLIDTTPEFLQSLRNTTDTSFVIPYSETCIQNVEALKSDVSDIVDMSLCTVLE